MPRAQSYDTFEARKLNLILRAKYGFAEYLGREASVSSDLDTSPSFTEGGCKRGKSRRPTAEGHRQRVERTQRSPEPPSFLKPLPTPISALARG